jgi:hypothetical protein
MCKFKLKKFKLLKLFEVKKGTGPGKEWADENPGPFTYLTASIFNNGCVAKMIENTDETKFEKHCITVSSDGTDIGTSFVQSEDFYALTNVTILRADMPILSLLFIAAVISNEKYRFNYGRKFNGDRMDLDLWLPVSSDGGLDHNIMAMAVKTAAMAVKTAAMAKYNKIQAVSQSFVENI